MNLEQQKAKSVYRSVVDLFESQLLSPELDVPIATIKWDKDFLEVSFKRGVCDSTIVRLTPTWSVMAEGGFNCYQKELRLMGARLHSVAEKSWGIETALKLRKKTVHTIELFIERRLAPSLVFYEEHTNNTEKWGLRSFEVLKTP